MSYIIYSRKTCFNCKLVKDHFDRSGIDYTVVDLDEDKEAYAKMIESGHRSIPLIYKNGEFIGDYAVGLKLTE